MSLEMMVVVAYINSLMRTLRMMKMSNYMLHICSHHTRHLRNRKAEPWLNFLMRRIVCMCALPGPLLTSITWPVKRWSSPPGFLFADHTSVENQGMSPWHSQHLSLYSCRLAEQRAPALLLSLPLLGWDYRNMPCAQQFLWILRIPIKVLVFAQQTRYWSRQRVPLLHFDICCFKTNLNGCFLTPQPMIFSLPLLPLAPPRLSLIRTPYSCDFRMPSCFLAWNGDCPWSHPSEVTDWDMDHEHLALGREIPTMFLTMVAVVCVVLHVSCSFMILCLWEKAVTILRLAVLTYS